MVPRLARQSLSQAFGFLVFLVFGGREGRVILVSSVVAHRRTTAPIFQNTPVDGSGLAPGVPGHFLQHPLGLQIPVADLQYISNGQLQFR